MCFLKLTKRFLLQVERKKGSIGGGKGRDGGAERFRAEILEESVIVCYFAFCYN